MHASGGSGNAPGAAGLEGRMPDDHVPDDIHPRSLIIAIQQNLGITKKEISERTGISYGTLNRYTRRSEDIGQPRRSSMQRLINLYRISLKRYGTAPDRDTASGHPGADYRDSLMGHRSVVGGGRGAAGLDGVDLRGLDPAAVARFVTKALYYAEQDVAHFRASNLRDRRRAKASRALLGDAYTALLHDLAAADFSARAEPPAADESDDTARDDEQTASASETRFESTGDAGA